MSAVIGRLLHPWRSGRLWPALVHTVLDLPVGLVVAIPTAILGALTAALTITLPLAVPPFIGLLIWTRAVGAVERSRAGALLGTRLADPIPRLPKGGPWAKLKSAATNRARWKHIAYCVLRLPLSVVLYGVVVGAWVWSAILFTLPLYLGRLPQDTAHLALLDVTPGPAAVALAIAAAVVLVLIAPWLTLGAGRIDAGFASWLLGPPGDRALAERVERAETGRTAAIDAAEAERRRIERDLHDGAQQRLVALAMDLGSARARLDTDPESAKVLVAEAHEEAKAALKEIRDLVRGIHPVILQDRGLDAALSAVVARSPIPVELNVALGQRLPEAVESAAYFVVSEALANVARHAQATRAHVGIATRSERLIVEVRDDGIGGADPSRGTGLQGLADRVLALGGTMDLLSPPGGPTTLLVELPCGS